MTTLHTDDVRNVPDRILNMLESRVDADRMENDVYQALDVGVLVRKKTDEEKVTRRYMDQICFYTREKGENKIEIVVFDGELITKNLPDSIMNIFKREGVTDPFYNEELELELSGNREEGKE